MTDLLSLRNSCYVGNEAAWSRFISAWKQHVPSEHKEYSIVNSIDLCFSESIGDLICMQEKKLGIAFPQSLKDFLGIGKFRNLEIEGEGFLNAAEVGWLKDIDRDYFDLLGDFSDDDVLAENYFKYGRSPLFTELLPGTEEHLLVIAKLSVSEYFLLNMQFKSMDGEYEVVYLTPSDRIRYPNFAEMMRQYSVVDCHFVNDIGPQSVKMLSEIEWIGNSLIFNPWWT